MQLTKKMASGDTYCFPGLCCYNRHKNKITGCLLCCCYFKYTETSGCCIDACDCHKIISPIYCLCERQQKKDGYVYNTKITTLGIYSNGWTKEEPKKEEMN